MVGGQRSGPPTLAGHIAHLLLLLFMQVLGNGTLYGGNVSFAALFNGSYYMPSYNLVYELFLAPNDTSALANVTFANSTAEDNFVYSVVPQPITCGAAVVYTVRANGEAVSAVLSCDGTIGECRLLDG
jgi:hypothetical protein